MKNKVENKQLSRNDGIKMTLPELAEISGVSLRVAWKYVRGFNVSEQSAERLKRPALTYLLSEAERDQKRLYKLKEKSDDIDKRLLEVEQKIKQLKYKINKYE